MFLREAERFSQQATYTVPDESIPAFDTTPKLQVRVIFGSEPLHISSKKYLPGISEAVVGHTSVERDTENTSIIMSDSSLIEYLRHESNDRTDKDRKLLPEENTIATRDKDFPPELYDGGVFRESGIIRIMKEWLSR
ncbi:hypothetical protein HYALB_00011151 [Hymenoscyphus albidus]|uniref:Uncharacterized protein n=1 Tax=Hymenoscyphus albidus TaxID=595503 RepID=A0A9N9LUJ9_9HELO|nr:hypothetical protein HYALB_00011151 [Hymenoscyphus albidus]